MSMISPVHLTSKDRSVGCPFAFTDTVHVAILFIDTLTKLGTIKVIRQLVRRIWR